MPSRRWGVLSAVCFLAAVWHAFYENLPVFVSNATPLFVATRNGKQGVVTEDGRIVVPFEWENIDPFDDHGLAVAALQLKNGPLQRIPFPLDKLGAIDRTGKIVVPAELSYAAQEFDDHGHFLGELNERLVIYDRHGKQLLKESWKPLAELEFDEHGLLAAENSQESGWINRDGVMVVRAPAELTPVNNFHSNGLAVVGNIHGQQGCVNLQGQLVIPTEWESIYAPARARLKNGKIIDDATPVEVLRRNPVDTFGSRLCGLASSEGRILVPANYKDIWPDYDRNLALVKDVNEKWGVFDFNGDVVIPPKFEELCDFDANGLATAKIAGKWGWINTAGQTVIPFEYDSYSLENLGRTTFDGGGLAVVSKAGYWGAIDSTGKVIIAFDYTTGRHCDRELQLYTFERDHLWGCLDSKGTVVVPFKFMDPIEFDLREYAFARSRDEGFLIDRTGAIHSVETDCFLSALPADLPGPWMKSNAKYNMIVGRKLMRAEAPDAHSRGVFSVDDGMIVQPLHEQIEVTEFGFRGTGRRRAETRFNSVVDKSRSLYRWALPSLVHNDNELEVLYDVRGNIIWSSDQRAIDLLKACGFAIYGFVCLRWSWKSRSQMRAKSDLTTYTPD